MTLETILTIGLLIPVLLMTLLWLISGRGANAAWVDFGWAVSIGLCAIFFSLVTTGDPTRRLILGVLPLIWCLRLSLYLLKDRVLGPHKDGRYDHLKNTWGNSYRWKFFLFFQMQAVLAYLLSLPFLLGGLSHSPFSGLAFLSGATIFLIAFVGETTADAQLAAFKANPKNKGKVCQNGLWKYSRHPNYFFEWLHWLSYVFILVDTPFWWCSLLVAALMLYLVLFVTGIPPTEEQSLKSRGTAYAHYQKTTSAFVPWFQLSSKGKV